MLPLEHSLNAHLSLIDRWAVFLYKYELYVVTDSLGHKFYVTTDENGIIYQVKENDEKGTKLIPEMH